MNELRVLSLIELSLSFAHKGSELPSLFLISLLLRTEMGSEVAIGVETAIEIGHKGVTRDTVLLARAEERKFLMRWSGVEAVSSSFLHRRLLEGLGL